MRQTLSDLFRVGRAVRPTRVLALLLASLLVGLLCDWVRTERRLVFPRPLPVFTTTTPR